MVKRNFVKSNRFRVFNLLMLYEIGIQVENVETKDKPKISKRPIKLERKV